MEKQDFDFSKPKDQQRFIKLPTEEKGRLIGEGQEEANSINKEKRPSSDSHKILRHVITDWANHISGLTCFDNNIDDLKKYLAENTFPNIYDQYQKEFDRHDLNKVSDLAKQVREIDAMTKRLLQAQTIEEFKQMFRDANQV